MATTRIALAFLLAALVLAATVSAVSIGGAQPPSDGSASAVAAHPAAPRPSTPTSTPAGPGGAKSGATAVEVLGSRLPDVARRQGWSAQKLRTTLLEDPTLHVDARERLFYADTTPPALAASAASAAPAVSGAAPYPLSDTFLLHSLPGAKLTILLDFGPRTMSGNAWTASDNGGNDIVCPAWSLDSDPAFSDTEKTAIQDVWRRVAEDYAPFNVDVTTQFTSEAAITRADLSDDVYGARVLISPISSYFGAYGGIAYVGVFDDIGDYYKPALVFPERLANDSKNIAEAATHEAGHNLALSHDGAPGKEYYEGSGSGETGWAPIMGVGYYRNLTQWSKGEYPKANNQEDDLDILRSYLSYQADDAGDTAATAVALPASTTLSAAGLITSSSDTDVYRFTAGAGAASVDVVPVPVGPNLDIATEVRDSGGTLIASDNPVDGLATHLTPTLVAGTYYLYVRGTGKGSPLDVGGYSSYGSIGRYTISGTVQDPVSVPVPAGTLAGTVTASGGGALSGVSISVPGTNTVTTAGDGTYTVAGVTPGQYTVAFSKLGYTSQNISVSIADGATTTQDVTLVPIPVPQIGTLAGTVTASGGGALSGVSVSVPGTNTVTTAGDGTYTVAGVTPGQYSVAFSKSGYTSQNISVSIADGATTTQDVTLVPIPVVTMTPVYRFFNKVNGSHFYTASEAEKNAVIANLSATYSLDGVAYRVSSAFTTPLYRFYNKVNGSHFYTASEAEKNSVIANLSAIYSYDGIAYRVSSGPTVGATPVYRFYNKVNGSHFYTASEAEKNSVIANLSAVYALDGVAFYVVP